MSQKTKDFVIGLILPFIVLAAWYYATTFRDISPAILPSIQSVLEQFVINTKSGQIIEDLFISLRRVVEGYAVSVALGVTLGIFMGISVNINRFFSLCIHMIRQIPMTAWIPLIIMWAGIGETSKIIIIVIGAFFPILVNTLDGILSTPKSFVEVADLYRLNRFEVIFRVYLPSALPQIFTGLKLGLGTSWMAVVTAEMLAASSGVGFRMSDARSLMQPHIVIVYMIIIGVVGVLMNQLLTILAKVLTPWSTRE